MEKEQVMFKKKDKSITSTLTLYMMGLMAAIVFLFIYANMGAERDQLEKSQKDMISSLGQIYVSLIDRPFSQGNYIQIESDLQTKSLPSFVKRIQVFDSENNIIASNINAGNSCSKIIQNDFPLKNSSFNEAVGLVRISSTSCIVREKLILSIITYLVVAFGILIFSYIAIQKLIEYSLRPMKEVIEKSTNTDGLTHDLIEAGPEEIRPLVNKLGEAYENMAKAELADEVAHNLSSPLFGMSDLIPKLKNKLSHEEWSLLNGLFGKVNRITQKLNFSRLSKQNEGESIYIDHVISDMIFEFNEAIFKKGKNVSLILDRDSSFGAFSSFPKNLLEETLINVLNNAYDACSNNSEIKIRVNEQTEKIEVIISDTGKGMGPNTLIHIFDKGFSFEKDHGTGSGLYQAKKHLPEFGGDIKVESKLGRGTTITIDIPKTDTPEWFLKHINLSSINRVVIVDDEQIIEDVWRKKLTGKVDEIIYFQDPSLFQEKASTLKAEGTLFLIDYEYDENSLSGVDLIKNNSLENAILVTNKLNDNQVFENCRTLDIPLLPKNLIGKIPLSSGANKSFIIDDDPYFIQTLEANLRPKGLQLTPLTINQARSTKFPKGSKVFVDSTIDTKDDGIELGKELSGQEGVKTILVTGYDKKSILKRYKDFDDYFSGFVKKANVKQTLSEITHYLQS